MTDDLRELHEPLERLQRDLDARLAAMRAREGEPDLRECVRRLEARILELVRLFHPERFSDDQNQP